MDKINIFISYSWDSQHHKDWALSLAGKLEEYFEIQVTFDQYDLDSSEDKNHFMEKGVFETKFILTLVTPQYVEKANRRLGGVGIETKMSSARHWEESLGNGRSSIIPLLREGNELPNYLKEKFYIDFREDDKFNYSFDELISHLIGDSKKTRPQKIKSVNKKPIHQDLTRIEDFLKINHKKRRLVFDKSDTTNFTAGNKIRFELWETRSPATDYYLFIFDGVTLRPTIRRFCELIKGKNISINRLTVLRPSKSERGYIDKLFKENDITFKIEEISFSDYIWEYCIDDSVKKPSDIYKQKFFIDQPIVTFDEELISKGPALEYLKKELNTDIQSTAKLIIAPGGTGKTTLCQYVASEYQNPERAISVLIQSEELRESGKISGYENIKIESVYDLYEVYTQVLSEQGDSQLTYDKNTFEVALITGRLVLVIDGMDEIISLFPEGLNLELFLESIEQLNRQLASCKIIITSRNDVFPAELMEKYDNLDKYRLLGFDEDACEKYLTRRFKDLEHKDKLKNKVLNSIRPLIKSDEKQRIFPFVVDLLSSLAEDFNEDPESAKIDLSFDGKNYESNEEITDYLVYSVLRREWHRQKIDIPIQDVLEIFLEISSTHKDTFSKHDFEDVIRIFCSGDPDELVVKMLRNPLLVIEGSSCRFKYDFISGYFKSLFIINAINSCSLADDFIKLIAKNAYDDSEVMHGVARYFSNPETNAIHKCNQLIKKNQRKNFAVRCNGEERH